MLTFYIYLNDVPEGGGTNFPKADPNDRDFAVQPKKGVSVSKQRQIFYFFFPVPILTYFCSDSSFLTASGAMVIRAAFQSRQEGSSYRSSSPTSHPRGEIWCKRLDPSKRLQDVEQQGLLEFVDPGIQTFFLLRPFQKTQGKGIFFSLNRKLHVGITSAPFSTSVLTMWYFCDCTLVRYLELHDPSRYKWLMQSLVCACSLTSPIPS